MMQIVYFSRKEQLLSHLDGIPGDKVFVAPSPAKADGLRSRLNGTHSQDVITIAKFTSNLVEALWENDRPDVKRKSELLLIFGILKNKYLPELGYEQFNQAYNLFSDLRSFTLDQDALTSVLDEQPEMIQKAVRLFWQLLDVTGYSDEHGAYQKITEALRSHEEVESLKKTYIFWGFQHLNGQQVDLLKSLAIRYEVIIPFPFTLKDKVKKSDWLSWIKDHKTSELILEGESFAPKAQWLSINSREVAKSLGPLLKDHDQVILGVSKLNSSHIDILPTQKAFFKIPHQILGVELAEVSDGIKKFRGSHVDLINYCNDQMKSARTMKHLRAWQLYQEALNSITEMTEEVIAVDSFFLKVLGEVVGLNQPRTSFVPVSPEKTTIDFKDMSSLEDIDRKRRVFLCVDDRFDEIQSLGSNYTESIQRSLAALGPMKRNELELLFKQWEFQDLFSHADVTVLMNEGTLKHSLIWKRLFQGIELVPISRSAPFQDRVLKDHFLDLPKRAFESTFSASKIQTFMDCPRKFYFSYIDKIFPDISIEQDIDPMLAGVIVHKIIETFFNEKKAMDELHALTKIIFNEYLAKENLSLPEDVFQKRELILYHRASNGISFIHDIESRVSEKITWQIEVPIKLQTPLVLNGQIDCVGVSDKYLFLLDFKSSASSAYTGEAVSKLEAIQLWVYALGAMGLIKDADKKTLVLGYVVLENPADSTLLTDDSELAASNKEKKFTKFHKLKVSMSEKLQEASDKMTALALAIKSEKVFPAKPTDKDACTFCELNQVCVKSELTNG